VDEDVKAQQDPISLSAGGKPFISCVSVTHVLYFLVLSCPSCFIYIYKQAGCPICITGEYQKLITAIKITYDGKARWNLIQG